MYRRLAALEARHWSRPSYVVELADDALADPVAVKATVAEHRRRTGWTGPVIVAPVEVTVEEWVGRHQRIEVAC